MKQRKEICLGSHKTSAGHEFHAHLLVEEANAGAAVQISFEEGYVPTEAEAEEAANIIAKLMGASYQGRLNIDESMLDEAEAAALVNDFFKKGSSEGAAKKREVN